MADLPSHLLRRLRLRHLELLVALGDQPTVHAAANCLSLSQPAVSKMLREIEEAFGASLFQRSRTGVRPNALGRAAIRRARIIENEIGNCAEEVIALRDGDRSLLRLGSVSVTSIVPDAILELRRREPRTIVRISEAPVDVLLQKLLCGELDCVVGALPLDLRGSPMVRELQSTIVYRDRMCVVVSSRSALAGAARKVWRSLAECDWVLPPPSSMVRQAFVSIHVEHGLEPPPATVETMSPVTMSALVRADPKLVGIMRHEQVRREREIPGLVELRVSPTAALPPLTLFTRRTRIGPSALAEAFRAALAAAVRL